MKIKTASVFDIRAYINNLNDKANEQYEKVSQ